MPGLDAQQSSQLRTALAEVIEACACDVSAMSLPRTTW
jgi:hypothetical protein